VDADERPITKAEAEAYLRAHQNQARVAKHATSINWQIIVTVIGKVLAYIMLFVLGIAAGVWLF
jgi:hypothetical protein